MAGEDHVTALSSPLPLSTRVIRRIMGKVRPIIGGYRALRNPLWTVQHIFAYLKIRDKRKQGSNVPIRVSLYGHRLWIRPLSPDYQVSINMFEDEFDPLIGILPREFNGLVIDAGGYNGTAAIRLQQIYPQATVITIEPHVENFCLLKKNISVYSNILAIKAALIPKKLSNIGRDLKESSKVSLYDRGTGQWGFTIVENATGKTKPKQIDICNIVTLSDICDRFSNTNVGILKLDIEGGEKALFESNDKNLLKDSYVFVELHERIVKGCNMAFKNFSKGRKIAKSELGEKYLIYPS